MEWVYVAVAVFAALGAFILGRMVQEKSTKRRVAAWLAVLFGAGFFLIYALNLDRDVFSLVVGLVCVMSGINALEAGRLHDRIHDLEKRDERLGK